MTAQAAFNTGTRPCYKTEMLATLLFHNAQAANRNSALLIYQALLYPCGPSTQLTASAALPCCFGLEGY